MSFAAPRAYDSFIGRYSALIAPRFVEFARLEAPPFVELGCGTGYLTAALARTYGAEAVVALDPSPPFVAACRERVPGARVFRAVAENIPAADDAFSGAVSQLAFPLFADAERACAEITRVVRSGGPVAACAFHETKFEAVRVFWDAALAHDPDAPNDRELRYRTAESLEALWIRAGFKEVEPHSFEVLAAYSDFDEFWAPLDAGVGPAGDYYRTQSAERQASLRSSAFERLGRPTGSFSLSAVVVAVRGVVP